MTAPISIRYSGTQASPFVPISLAGPDYPARGNAHLLSSKTARSRALETEA